MDGSYLRQLHQLARLYGVQTSFHNVEHKRQWATADGLVAVLRALGAPIAGERDLTDAQRQRRREICEQMLDPVTVAWGRRPVMVMLRLPGDHVDDHLRYTVALESGDVRSGTIDRSQRSVVTMEEVDGCRYVFCRFSLPGRLPWGCHRLTIENGARTAQSLVVAAPETVYAPRSRRFRRQWGLFAPLYALRSMGNWGCGDFGDGEALVAWTAAHGGSLVGTLPFLATFLDLPCDPSPYTPVSRLFWNEFFLDVSRLPELAGCPAAQAVVVGSDFQRELRELRASPLVDYPRQMGLKRRVLTTLAQHLFAERARGHDRLQRFLANHPCVADYARFRAALEHRRTRWPQWPDRQRNGDIRDDDFDHSVWQYHVYVQFAAEEQVAALAQRAAEEGVRLYLDLPLGVHADGYDIWRYQDLFARDVSVGAPPDAFFPTGQDWSFPPWRPEVMRRRGYDYLIACLRHQLRHAKMLRLDHVMGLHRFYWIPRGGGAKDGVYVRYPSDEIYAVLSLESHRHKAVLIGENLGIVPEYVNRAMHRHGMAGMSVVLHELVADPEGALRRLVRRPRTVTCLGTHDMYPFAAFWRDEDIADRLRLGIIRSDEAERERGRRRRHRESFLAFLRQKGLVGPGESEQEILKAILALLGGSAAQTVLINLEDLWLETIPQNIPGTVDEHPNWRQKGRLSLEEFIRHPEVVEMLKAIGDLRRVERAPAGSGRSGQG